MNSINLVGRLSDNPTLRTTQTGKSVASFTIAVNRDKDNADFFNCVVWGVQADNLCKYQTKGSQIGLTGRLSKRSYEDKNGEKKYIIEVVAEHIEYLGSKKEESSTISKMETDEIKVPQNYESNYEGTNDVSIQLSDQDLPF